MENKNPEEKTTDTKDAELPDQSSNIVGDVPPVATSKKKKMIMLGCGFCVLLILCCAGIGLPMVAKLKRSVEKAAEEIKAENDAQMQRLEEQHELESNYEETLEADSDQASGSTDDEDQED
ncbi:MAG TPA: hypothetical protein EYN93_02410 [Planctomycetaceae bacterium]|nr:hypothetical protein [Planctomycetaceae bacterium]